MVRTLLLLLPLVAVTTSMPARAAPGDRVELPGREIDLPNGDRRYALSLQIDGQTVDAGIDTGSTGLRVLSRAIPQAAGQRGSEVGYFYTSGTEFRGRAVDVPVSLGGLSATVRVQRIDSVGCTRQKPDCPASRVDADRYGIQGDGLPGQGFVAILGIGLKPDAIANPFEMLGARQWILDLPVAGKAGRLILNPSLSDLAGFRRFSIADDGNDLPTCLVGPQADARICGMGHFDSGAPGIVVTTRQTGPAWRPGTPMQIVMGDKKAIAAMQVTVGRRDEGSAMRIVPNFEATAPRISLGLAPYFHWSVLYDATARQIGLRDR